jgi:hypothetical protein
LISGSLTAFAQPKKLPVIPATSAEAQLLDGKYVRLAWHLDPSAKPDIYYVNVPRKPGRVTLVTDKAKINIDTRFGKSYDLLVLLNGRDSCHIRVVAGFDTASQWQAAGGHGNQPDTIPFTLQGSRIYLKGILNDKKVNVQLDLGAGTNCVNKTSSAKLGLAFDSKRMVSNTQGLNEMPVSSSNRLSLGRFSWRSLPLTEVGNMQPEEDIIIGNTLFRDKILEIDYDRLVMVVHTRLPATARGYNKQPVWFEQSRPKFEATLRIAGKTYPFWFLFDTGRDGTMLIGEDFTGVGNTWNELTPLTVINGRKIIRLDAVIAGTTFPDVVTNAADPAQPKGRPTLFGNQLLNHFNVILDNIHGDLYLRPNGRANEPYSNYQSYLDEQKK